MTTAPTAAEWRIRWLRALGRRRRLVLIYATADPVDVTNLRQLAPVDDESPAEYRLRLEQLLQQHKADARRLKDEVEERMFHGHTRALRRLHQELRSTVAAYRLVRAELEKLAQVDGGEAS